MTAPNPTTSGPRTATSMSTSTSTSMRPAASWAPAPGQVEPDPADQAWEAMCSLVLDNERRREVSEALGMSFAKIKALRRLADCPMTGKELAAELLTDAPRASMLIDELVQRGLAERRVHPEDRRVRIVALTDLGAVEAERARAILHCAPKALRGLPPEELAALNRILRPLAAS
jgi:DNA-binding MarR family transcriptional regulator